MFYRLARLDEIWSYVAEEARPTTADRLIDDIIDRFHLLAEQPEMGRAHPEFGPGVRPSRSRTTSSTIVAKATTF
jgi:plasmid stabilization system protein ParE